MFDEAKTIIPFPLDAFNQLVSDISFLKKQSITPKVEQKKEWLTRQEFMDQCSISGTQFNIWRTEGKLKLNRLGKKLFVHASCVDQYFNGEFHKHA